MSDIFFGGGGVRATWKSWLQPFALLDWEPDLTGLDPCTHGPAWYPLHYNSWNGQWASKKGGGCKLGLEKCVWADTLCSKGKN